MLNALETERLIIRGFQESDYEDLYEFLSQRKEDAFEAYPNITYDNIKEHLNYRVGSEEFYALELKSSGKVIGNVYLGKRDFEARELGYIINKNYQRMGYASEAVKAVMKQAFENGVHRIYAETDPRNLCSWGLLESLGFLREACFRKNVYFKKDQNDKPIWQDTYVYCVLNER